MRVQDYFVEVSKEAAKEAFRYARAVPADKLEWQPLEKGRSVLDLCRELALTPTWAYDTIEGTETETQEAQKEVQANWKTVEDCEAEYDRRAQKLFDLYSQMPDERLNEKKWLPYEGGRDFTVLQMMEYPRWNATYHLGQIAYIQILYGDNEIH